VSEPKEDIFDTMRREKAEKEARISEQRKKNLTLAGRGRKKGTKNIFTRNVKEMILEALSVAGGVKYLAKQAEDNPVAFMGLLGKVLPMTLAADSNVQVVWNLPRPPLEGGAIIDGATGVVEEIPSAKDMTH